MKCERKLTESSDSKCGRPASAFVMGQNVCAAHDTAGSDTCSHSLAPSDRCSFCGARVETESIDLTGGRR